MTRTQQKIVRKIAVLCMNYNLGLVSHYEFNRQLGLRLDSARQAGLIDEKYTLVL